MKNEKSKSEQRREVIQKSEVSDAKSKTILTATKNTFLPNGTFIAKGEKVEVSAEYAEEVKKTNDQSFI